MKFKKFVAFLIYETSCYLVIGLTNDCTKYYNYLKGDSNDYENKSCCSIPGIKCDEKGYILSYEK